MKHDNYTNNNSENNATSVIILCLIVNRSAFTQIDIATEGCTQCAWCSQTHEHISFTKQSS